MGFIAFITNRAYLEARQDDGFRRIAVIKRVHVTFTSWTWARTCGATPKISGSNPGNVFGISDGCCRRFLREFEEPSHGTGGCATSTTPIRGGTVRGCEGQAGHIWGKRGIWGALSHSMSIVRRTTKAATGSTQSNSATLKSLMPLADKSRRSWRTTRAEAKTRFGIQPVHSLGHSHESETSGPVRLRYPMFSRDKVLVLYCTTYHDCFEARRTSSREKPAADSIGATLGRPSNQVDLRAERHRT